MQVTTFARVERNTTVELTEEEASLLKTILVHMSWVGGRFSTFAEELYDSLDESDIVEDVTVTLTDEGFITMEVEEVTVVSANS